MPGLFCSPESQTFYLCTVLRELMLLLIMFQAGLSDIRSRRIPNEMLASGALFLIPFLSVELSIKGLLLVFCLMLLWRLGLIGGGDVKLILLILLVKGAADTVKLLAVGAVLAGIYGGSVLVIRHELYASFRRLGSFLVHYRTRGGRYLEQLSVDEQTLPMAAFFYIGNLMVIALEGSLRL